MFQGMQRRTGSSQSVGSGIVRESWGVKDGVMISLASVSPCSYDDASFLKRINVIKSVFRKMREKLQIDHCRKVLR
jgi:hypothetical protein